MSLFWIKITSLENFAGLLESRLQNLVHCPTYFLVVTNVQVSVSELSPWSLKGPLGAVIVFPSTHIMSAWCFLKHFEGSVAVVGSRRRFIPMTSGIACMSLWVFPVRRWLFETESLYVGICPPEVDQCDLVGSNLLLTWNWGRNVNGVQDCGPS